MVEIRKRSDLYEWLDRKDRTRQEMVAIAARGALRVMPFMLSEGDKSDKAARRRIASLRCVLTAEAFATNPDSEEALRTAAFAADAFAADAADDAAAFAAAAAAADAAAAAADAAADAADAFAFAFAFATRILVWTAIGADLNLVDRHKEPALLFSSALWHDKENPFENRWLGERKSFLAAKDEHWWPWIEWYEGHLRGGPKNAALLRDIALLPDEDWRAGPAVINPKIAALWRAAHPRLSDEDLAALLEQDTGGLPIETRAETVAVTRGAPAPDIAALLPSLERRARRFRDRLGDDDHLGEFAEDIETLLDALARGAERVAQEIIPLYFMLNDLANKLETDTLSRHRSNTCFSPEQATAAQNLMAVGVAVVYRFPEVEALDRAQSLYDRIERNAALEARLLEATINRTILLDIDRDLLERLFKLARENTDKGEKAQTLAGRTLHNILRVLVATASGGVGQVSAGMLKQFGIDLEASLGLSEKATALIRDFHGDIRDILPQMSKAARVVMQKAIDGIVDTDEDGDAS